MEKITLKDLLNRAEDELRKENYREETIQDYKYVWDKFYKHWQKDDLLKEVISFPKRY